MLFCGFQNCLARHHNAEVNHFETIARKHDADDVLADIMHIAVGCSEHYTRLQATSSCFVRGIDVWLQNSHSVLHDLSRADDLWQEHLSFAKQDTDVLHGLHEWSLDDLNRLTIFSKCLGHILHEMTAVALCQSELKTLLNGEIRGKGHGARGKSFVC